MKVVPTTLPGVLLLEPQVFGDDRGFFLESYNRQTFAGLGIDEEFVQDNHSFSIGNTLRGLHIRCGSRKASWSAPSSVRFWM